MPPSDMFKRCEGGSKDQLFLISPVWENLPVRLTLLLWKLERNLHPCVRMCMGMDACTQHSQTQPARSPACLPARPIRNLAELTN